MSSDINIFSGLFVGQMLIITFAGILDVTFGVDGLFFIGMGYAWLFAQLEVYRLQTKLEEANEY